MQAGGRRVALTVVTRLTSSTGNADAIIEAVAEHFERAVRPRRDCEMAYLFQHVDDANSFVHVAAWRGHWDVESLRSAALPPLGPLLDHPPVVHRAIQIESRERIGVPIAAMGCTMVEGPAGGSDHLRATIVRVAHAALRDWSETHPLVLYRIYQDADRPWCWAIVHCWQYVEALAEFETARHELLGSLTHDLGATVERFAGESRAVVSRFNPS
jgi:hypothetical protein